MYNSLYEKWLHAEQGLCKKTIYRSLWRFSRNSENRFGGQAVENMRLKTRKLERKAVNDNFLFEPSIHLVAGEGFEPTTFGL